MICLIALVAFGILGIFSAKYRSLSKEAFNCVFRRITLRRCETGFDKRMKAKIIGKMMGKSPRLAGAVHRHFEAISWFFTLSLVVSAYYAGLGAYNYSVYGNCNGPHSDGFCIYDPTGSNKVLCGSEHCEKEGCTCGGGEENCTQANNYAACGGNCTCNRTACG